MLDLQVLNSLNAERAYLGEHGLTDWLSAVRSCRMLEHRAGIWRFTHDELPRNAAQ